MEFLCSECNVAKNNTISVPFVKAKHYKQIDGNAESIHPFKKFCISGTGMIPSWNLMACIEYMNKHYGKNLQASNIFKGSFSKIPLTHF